MSLLQPPEPQPDDIGIAFESLSEIQTLLQVAQSMDLPVCLVGGAVRDWLYARKISLDWDFVVPAGSAKSFSEALAKAFQGKHLCLDEHYQIYRVILFPSLQAIDIADCVGPDIETDLGRRDLAVNAIAYDFSTRQLIDPYGGLSDLRARIIRMVKAQNLLDDPLRLLRPFRFSAELGMPCIDAETLSMIRLYGNKVLQVAAERIHYEMMKLLSAPICYPQIRMMADVGMLECLFPELTPMHQVPPNLYHHLNLFDHTLELLNQAEIHFSDLSEPLQENLLEELNPFTKRLALVRLACLFHDTGKPMTMREDPESKKVMFHQHEAFSEYLTWGAGIRSKWGKDITRSVAHLARWHLYPGDILKPEVTPKAYRKFFNRIGDLLPEMILLAIADRYSTQGPEVNIEELPHRKAQLMSLWELYQQYQAELISMPRLLTGEEVMKILRIQPGPQVGRILKALSEAQLNGELTTPEEAVGWLKQSTVGAKHKSS